MKFKLYLCFVVMTALCGCEIGGSVAAGKALGNDGEPSISVSSESITEGNSNEPARTVEDCMDIIEYNFAEDMYPNIANQYAEEYLEAEKLGASLDLIVGECDLNDDGQTDYIVILYSALYGGSHGHLAEALITTPSNSDMTRISMGIGSEPYILRSKTNGLYDFIYPENPDGIFRYNGENSYEFSESTKHEKSQLLNSIDSVCLELLSEAGLTPNQSPFGFSIGGTIERNGREYICVYLFQYNPQMVEQSLLLDSLYFDEEAEKLLVLEKDQQLCEIENNRYINAFSPDLFPTEEENAVYRDPANDAIVSSFSQLPIEPILSEAEAAIILEKYLFAREKWGENYVASPEGAGKQYGNYYYIVRQRVIHNDIAPTADEFYVNPCTGALYHANDFFSPEDDSISLCLYTD